MQLLFLPPVTSLYDQRQKELSYASGQAHLARRSHAYRRVGSNENVHVAIDNYETRSHTESRCLITSCLVPSLASTEDYYAHRVFPFRGNSDPFDCQLFPVTPRINQAVCFVRFYLNRCWSPNFMLQLIDDSILRCPLLGSGSAVGLVAAKWLWNLFNTNQGVFWSAVASILPLMRRFVHRQDARHLDEIALELKVKSVEYLRRDLDNLCSSQVPSMSLVYHVKALFREASMNGDIQDALTHAKMLEWLVSKLKSDDKESTFLRLALWSDATSALLQLRRPIFNYQSWMPDMLREIWTYQGLPFLDLSHVHIDLPDSIINQTIRDAFVFVRHILHFDSSLLGLSYAETNAAEHMFQWVRTKVDYHMCCLLELYFDLIEGLSAEVTMGETYTEAGMCLALLYILQKSFCDVTRSDGLDFHESASVVQPALLKIMQVVLSNCSKTERLFYGEAHLLDLVRWCIL